MVTAEIFKSIYDFVVADKFDYKDVMRLIFLGYNVNTCICPMLCKPVKNILYATNRKKLVKIFHDSRLKNVFNEKQMCVML